MESGFIKDFQITASSQNDANHAAIQGRLNFKAGGGKRGGWSTFWNNANQWIQVALGSYTKLTSIATQGRNGHSQWVTKYKLQYSDDGVNFHYYKDPGQSSPKVKQYPSGNSSRSDALFASLWSSKDLNHFTAIDYLLIYKKLSLEFLLMLSLGV